MDLVPDVVCERSVSWTSPCCLCVREPIMDPVLDVACERAYHGPVLDLCVREPIMDQSLMFV